MDKRYHPMPVTEQMRVRRQAIEDVLAHPEWTPADAIRAADVVVAQGEIPASGTVRAAELTAGRFVLNLAPVTALPLEVIRRADPLVVNEHEAGLVLAMLDPEREASQQDAHSEVARALVGAGVASVVTSKSFGLRWSNKSRTAPPTM